MPTPAPRVFVVQEPVVKDTIGGARPKFDLEPAREYGDLVTLLTWGDSRRGRFTTDELVWMLRQRMAEYTAADYLLCTGAPSAIAIATALAVELTGGKVQLLSWDRWQNKYEVLAINLRCAPPSTAARRVPA